MVEVLNAMQLLNRHVKDLKWIKEWLRVCKCPKERCPEFKRKQGYRSSLDDMDKAAYEHYGVQLNAACNVGYGTADSVPIIGFDDWDEAEYYIEEESSDFVYPDTDDIEELRSRIKQDYDYIYATKDLFINYFLVNAEKENATANIIKREHRDDGHKTIGVEIIISHKSYRFHCRSEHYYDLHPEIPVDESKQEAKFNIYNYSKSEVANAMQIVEEFLKSRNIQLPMRG